MNRSIALALTAIVLVGACSDQKSTTVATAPEVLPAQPAPPAVEAPAVAMPPLPSVTEKDADPAAAPVAERPTPVETDAATAKDSAATDPKGTLTKTEETNSMPMAAHGNNHSSPSLEPPSPPADRAPPK
jgi:hypothetical protein